MWERTTARKTRRLPLRQGNGARNVLDATLGSLDLSRVRQGGEAREQETTTMGVLLALLLLAVPIAWLALLSLVAFLGVMAVAGALSIVAKWRTWSAV